MFKHYFERIENIEIWPIISLLIFFTFFIGLFIWVFTADRSYVKRMSGLPFEEDEMPSEPQNSQSHE